MVSPLFAVMFVTTRSMFYRVRMAICSILKMQIV